jgi:hypothetical protein
MLFRIVYTMVDENDLNKHNEEGEIWKDAICVCADTELARRGNGTSHMGSLSVSTSPWR